jgi:hypothetical protein
MLLPHNAVTSRPQALLFAEMNSTEANKARGHDFHFNLLAIFSDSPGVRSLDSFPGERIRIR